MGADSGVPPVIFNLTWAETGTRAVLTPLRTSVWRRIDPSMPLISAALSSARFPYVTPAGSILADQAGLPQPFRADPSAKDHFVDGGYYDNSGADSLANLVLELRNAELPLRERARFVNAGISASSNYRWVIVRINSLGENEAAPSSALSELVSPARAALAAGTARASESVQLLFQVGYLSGHCRSCRVGFDINFHLCPNMSSPTPTGWLLSERADDWIDQQVVAGSCSDHMLYSDPGAEMITNKTAFADLIEELQASNTDSGNVPALVTPSRATIPTKRRNPR